ncbi:uncharacterized protein LOC119095740 [Pollicipes pollicipes]|uniref:uncharacterized protein LOC119095740 n=1 Tax=Pollicipes pollicipes TaxID=41117 RepID=UPI0018849743|nr:uncharacterized protein LOC119095740 [Pollicipes pollicipes]
MALIIGNSNYQKLEVLRKVDEDVPSFRAKMERLGFGTLVAMNLTTSAAWETAEYFARLAAPGAYLVVLLAGHGFTHQRQDYLMPVDHPRLGALAGPDLAQCLCLYTLECRLQRTNPAMLLMCADTCRSPGPPEVVLPPRRRQERLQPTRNVMRLYSTQVGHEALDDGCFMSHLLNNIGEDITIQELGMRTLRIQGVQFPIAEISVAAEYSLRDCADHRTTLDVVLTRRRENICDPSLGLELGLQESWSTYIWHGRHELLLTLELTGPARHICVWNVLPVDCSDGQARLLSPQLAFRRESGDQTSLRSSWRLTGLTPVPGWVTVNALVVLARGEQRTGYVLRERRLLLGPLGLEEAPEQRPTSPECKLSNVEPR